MSYNKNRNGFKSTEYQCLIVDGDKLYPSGEINTIKKLPPGAYTVKQEMSGRIIIQACNLTCDKIVDLPNSPYNDVITDLKMFLSEDCRQRFKEKELLPKNNMLLHGRPGFGKSIIVNRVGVEVIDRGGIVLFNPYMGALKEIFKLLDSVQPNDNVLVIMEELDEQINQQGEEEFLHILDGETQKENAIFIATTNNLHKIPERIRRAGRFPVVLEITAPSFEARHHYLTVKMGKEFADNVTPRTEGLSIDQLKEIIRLHYCLLKPLDEAIKRASPELSLEDYIDIEDEEEEECNDY